MTDLIREPVVAIPELSAGEPSTSGDTTVASKINPPVYGSTVAPDKQSGLDAVVAAVSGIEVKSYAIGGVGDYGRLKTVWNV